MVQAESQLETDVLKEVQIDNVKAHVLKLSSLGSRVTGYKGANETADYTVKTLKGYGLNVSIQEYQVYVPIDHGAEVHVIIPENRSFQAHTLWPNSIQTSPIPSGGVTGPLIYAGTGELGEFNGKEVNGSFVLMEFNSGQGWLNAAKLGAKGVIFIAPSFTNRFEAMNKFLLSPLYFPRLYVSYDDGNSLKRLALAAGTVVKVKSNMTYEPVQGKNIIAEVPGREVQNEVIVIGAHYDTWSIVPALAPGADEATGVSVLLELARYFSQHRPRRTVWLVALSGHWEGLAGAREFVEQFVFGEAAAGGKRIWMFAGLDFSTDSEQVSIVYVGNFYRYGVDQPETILPRYQGWVEPRINQYIIDLEAKLKKSYRELAQIGFRTSGWWTSIPTPYMLDSEPFSVCRGVGFTFRTNNAYRFNWGHPLATFDLVKFENLRTQIEVSAYIMDRFLNEVSIGIDWGLASPVRIFYGVGGAVSRGGVAGYITANGTVLRHNMVSGWYEPIGEAFVVISSPTPYYPFGYIVTKAGSDGRFIVHGLGPGPVITSWTPTGLAAGYTVSAYILNRSTGLIEYAPDLGIYGSMRIFPTITGEVHPYPVSVVVFRTVTTVMFDILYPDRLSPMTVIDYRFGGGSVGGFSSNWQSFTSRIVPYNYYTLGELNTYGFVHFATEPVAMVFVPPGERFIVLFRAGPQASLVTAIVNASSEYPEGYGYRAEDGEIRLINPVYNYATNLLQVSFNRYNTLLESFVRSESADRYIREASRQASTSRTLLEHRSYDRAHWHAWAAWGWIKQGYGSVMGLIGDVAVTSAIFFSILIPFVLVFERLIFSGQGAKRLLSIMGVALACLAGFYFFHPALKLITNAPVGMLGLTLIALFLVVLAIFFEESVRILKELRLKLLGQHFAERGTMSTTIVAFPMSILNMRRRRLRTLLTMVTLILITFSLSALTSSTVIPGARSVSVARQAPYNGLLIRAGPEGRVTEYLTGELADLVGALAGDKAMVFPRVWYYPQSVLAQEVVQSVRGPAGKYGFAAALGIAPEESDVTFGVSLVSGRPFLKTDLLAAIIPLSASKATGLEVGDTITWGGITLTIVGIYEPAGVKTVDLDGRQFTPVDPAFVPTIFRGILPGEEQYNPLPLSDVLIVPQSFAELLGGYVTAISVRLDDPQLIKNLADELARILGVEVYAGYAGSVTFYSRAVLYAFQGWQYLVFPLVIGGFIVLNTMLGAVKERVREIGIYSSLGISPAGAGVLFVIEAFTYAVISVLLGYLAGIGLNTVLISYGLLPKEFILNYASLSVAAAITLCFGATVLSSSYAVLSAARLVTPSLERRWRPKTKPRGDEWSIPLPFSTSEVNEIYGVLAYLEEFLQASTVEEVQRFTVRSLEPSYSQRTLEGVIALPPLEANVTQHVTLTPVESKERFDFALGLRRLSGTQAVWVSSNYLFTDTLRKQLLLWRSLTEKERLRYVKEGLARLASEQVAPAMPAPEVEVPAIPPSIPVPVPTVPTPTIEVAERRVSVTEMYNRLLEEYQKAYGLPARAQMSLEKEIQRLVDRGVSRDQAITELYERTRA